LDHVADAHAARQMRFSKLDAAVDTSSSTARTR